MSNILSARISIRGIRPLFFHAFGPEVLSLEKQESQDSNRLGPSAKPYYTVPDSAQPHLTGLHLAPLHHMSGDSDS